MAHNSADEDPNNIKDNSSLEFKSNDDNFDDFFDDELNPTPMTDEHLQNNHYGDNIPDYNQQNAHNLNQNPPINGNLNLRNQNPNNNVNFSAHANIEPIPQKNDNNKFINRFEHSNTANHPVTNNTTSNISLSKASGVSLKILNKDLINKNSQDLYPAKVTTNSMSNKNNNENSSFNLSNKSEISFPPLPTQSSLNLQLQQQQQQQQQQSVPPRDFGTKLLRNINVNNNNINNSAQSIPGIPVVESGSGNFNSSLQSSLFTKNEDGSTIINFPPLKGENDKKSSQIVKAPAMDANQPLQIQIGGNKIINFPPLKNETTNEQQNKTVQPQQQQNEVQNSMQLPSISGIDQSQSQQPSQIRVSIKPKFLLKQTPQSSKPQVSFNPNQPKIQNLPIGQIQDQQNQNQLQSTQQSQMQTQVQIPSSEQFQQNQKTIQNSHQIQSNSTSQQNHQQSQIQIPTSQQFQPNIQQQAVPTINSNQQLNVNPPLFSSSSISHIQSNYILTPTDRVAISFENKLDLSLSSLRRSISSELSTSLRHPLHSNSGTSPEQNQDLYSLTGRLPSSFDSDIDSFLDNLNNELINAVSFAPLIGIADGSFSTSVNNNNINNINNINNVAAAVDAATASPNNTELMNVSGSNNNNNINNINNIKNSYLSNLSMSINMSFAAERYVSILAQNIGNAIDENIRPITSGLAASSIVDKQLCNEQIKSLQKLKSEINSLRSLFKSGASQIFEKLNQKISLFESNDQEDANRRKRFNISLNELRFTKKDLEMQLQKQIEEKEKTEAGFRNLASKRKKNFIENFSKSGDDMKLNKLIKIVESIEKEIRNDNTPNKNRNMSFSIDQNDFNYLNSIDSPKMFSDLINTLENGEKIMNIDEESMRMHLMDLTASNRWIANNLSAMSRFIENENISNSSILNNRSQLQLQYSPGRTAPIGMMSPRRENLQTSFT